MFIKRLRHKLRKGEKNENKLPREDSVKLAGPGVSFFEVGSPESVEVFTSPVTFFSKQALDACKQIWKQEMGLIILGLKTTLIQGN